VALTEIPQAFSHVGLINAAWRLTEATVGAGAVAGPGQGAEG
jgi:hypothetical protein